LLKDNISLIGASVVSLAAFFLFYREWKRVGVIGFTDLPILEHPPEGISPGLGRYVQQMAWDESVVVANILDLAVKGFITIKEEKVGRFSIPYMVLVKNEGADDSGLPEDEKLLLSLLFDDGNSFVLDYSTNAKLFLVMEQFREKMEELSEGVYFEHNKPRLKIPVYFLFTCLKRGWQLIKSNFLCLYFVFSFY